MKTGIFLENEWGSWGATWEENKLVSLHLPGSLPQEEEKIDLKKNPLLEKVAREISEYLEGKRFSFDIPYLLIGTEFQGSVWQELLNIPYGETRTYGDIAKKLGSLGKARAVGGACNKNPLAIIVPCHRVIGRNGNLVGFGGGLFLKRKLLDLEGGCLSGN